MVNFAKLHPGLIPAIGYGKHNPKAAKTIRLIRYGCANRPFFHIVVAEKSKPVTYVAIEQLGTFDPMPNVHNEKLCSFNFERVKYWIGIGADLTYPAAQLLGLAGFFPIHPRTYMTAWRNRRKREEASNAEVKEESK